MTNNENIRTNKIGNRKPFALPENYFDNFPTEMERRIAQEAKHRPSSRPLTIRRAWIYGAVAASLAAAVMAGQLLFSANKEPQTTAAERYETYVLSQVNESAIIDYYLNEGTE